MFELDFLVFSPRLAFVWHQQTEQTFFSVIIDLLRQYASYNSFGLMNTQLNWWWWVCMRVCKPVCSLIIEIPHNGDWLLRRWSRQLIWSVSVCLSRRGWKHFIESCLHVRGLRLLAQRTCLIAGCSALFGKSLIFRKVAGRGGKIPDCHFCLESV